MAARGCCHVAHLSAMIGTALASLAAILLLSRPAGDTILTSDRWSREADWTAGVDGLEEEADRWMDRIPRAEGGQLMGLLPPPRAAEKFRQWEDEERSLLRQALRPRHLARFLDGVAGGSRGGWAAGVARWRQPRRSLKHETPGECRTKERSYPSPKYPNNTLLTWQPRPDRFVLAICHYGQLSNQLKCMSNYFLVAALLNRTLVIPPGSFERGDRYRWEWDWVVDRAHANACFAPGAVLSLAELRARLGTPSVAIDKVACFSKYPGFCKPAERWETDGLGIVPPAGAFSVLPHERPSKEEFLRMFANDSARVISFNDLYSRSIVGVAGGRPFWPIASHCPDGGIYLRSHPAIRAAAEGFSRTMLDGGRFIGMHLRRGDFYKFCGHAANACFWPDVPAVARALLRHAERRNVTKAYVATNAHGAETELLQKLLTLPGLYHLELTVLPRLDSLPASLALPWAKEWIDLKFDDSLYATAILDKLICVQSDTFLGSTRSTYTDDIYRIRWAEGKASCEDEDAQELRTGKGRVPGSGF